MLDFTYSESVNILLTNGFLLGDESIVLMDSLNGESGVPFQIFVHPQNHVVMTMTGSENSQILRSQMYFTWKPLSRENLTYMLENSHLVYLPNVLLFGRSNNLGDSQITAFPQVSSAYFENIWAFYTMVVDNGIFLSWQINPNISLLTHKEKKAFIGLSPQEVIWKSHEKLKSILLKLSLSPDTFGLV
jgi:hypothetical protein